MKIQCNNCTKTYLVYSDRTSKLGRKVKSTNCNHAWHEYLQERDVLRSTDIQEKESGRKSFLVFATLSFIVVSGLCVAIANPREMDRVYEAIGSYKDSVSYKLWYKKKQTDSPNIKRLAAIEFYQDYLFLTNLRSS